MNIFITPRQAKANELHFTTPSEASEYRPGINDERPGGGGGVQNVVYHYEVPFKVRNKI